MKQSLPSRLQAALAPLHSLSREELQDAQYTLPYHHIPRGWKWRDKEEYDLYIGYIAGLVRELGSRDLLDVGCGDGHLLSLLGYGYGVDLSPRAVRWAIALGLDVSVRDARDVPGRFQIVTAIEVLEHVPDAKVREFTRMLADRSARWIVLSVPTTNAKLNPKHYRHYTRELLLDHIGNAFTVKRLVWVCERRFGRWRLESDARRGRHLIALGAV